MSEEGHFSPFVEGGKTPFYPSYFAFFIRKITKKTLIFASLDFCFGEVRIIYIAQSDCASCSVSLSGLNIPNSLLYSGELQIRLNLMRIISGTDEI